jgi:hypothetical protein
VHQVPVYIGMNRNGPDTEFSTGAQDPQRDLATIADDDLLKHGAPAC